MKPFNYSSSTNKDTTNEDELNSDASKTFNRKMVKPSCDKFPCTLTNVAILEISLRVFI